jgi:hypothetical protein
MANNPTPQPDDEDDLDIDSLIVIPGDTPRDSPERP